MSRSALVKQMQVMIHELRIHYRLEQQREEKDGASRTREKVEREVVVDSCMKNQQILQQKLAAIHNELSIAHQ
jgi:hypothetical protein